MDNNTDPNIIDGKLFEVTAPQSGSGGNLAPGVNAGPDQTLSISGSAQLDGTVSDDGLPNPPALVTATWNMVSGPGTVTFGNANSVDTTATFSAAGKYTLRLTASDGQLSTSDDAVITVTLANGGVGLDVRVSASSDDAEEKATGSVGLTSTDLELVYDVSNQVVGMRFNNVNIPKGAAITNAYIQFTVNEAQSEATSLLIQGQAVDNAATFTDCDQ